MDKAKKETLLRVISKYAFGVLVLCVLLIIALPCVRVLTDSKRSVEIASDSLLRVVNNRIYLGNQEVYRFIPVEGGYAEIGGVSSIRINDTPSLNYSKKHIDSFIIGQTPVRIDLWNYVTDGTLPNYSLRPEDDDGVYVADEEYTTWVEFINKLNKLTNRRFRLPTNDEWEYAARGGKYSHGFKYSGSDDLSEVAFMQDSTKDSTKVYGIFHEGKRKKPNELGLYDMSGGVWEITSTKRIDAIKELRVARNAIENGRAKFYPGDGKTKEDYYRMFDSYVSRGGSSFSSSEECTVNYLSELAPTNTGARLVLEY